MPSTSKIDQKLFEQFCIQQLSEKEIAEYFGVDRSTINKYCKKNYKVSFSTYLQEKRLQGKAVLVNKALKLAEKNGAVMIFLLKNWCGYTDTPKEANASNEELKLAFEEWAKHDKQSDQ